MNHRLIIAVIAGTAAVIATLAGCSGTGTTGTAAKNTPPPDAVATVDAATAGVVCAGINALVRTGDSTADAITTAMAAHGLTRAQVSYAIARRCPSLKAPMTP